MITHYKNNTSTEHFENADANIENTVITVIAYVYKRPTLIRRILNTVATWTQTFPYNLATMLIVASIVCPLLRGTRGSRY